MSKFDYHHIEAIVDINEMAVILAKESGDGSEGSYIGWMRLLTNAVIREEISGYDMACKNISEGGWELVSIDELKDRITPHGKEFNYYLNEFRVLVNNFQVYEWVEEKSIKKDGGLIDVDNVPSSHLLIIAALVDLLKNNTRLDHNQASLTEEIGNRYKDIPGVSVSNMEKLFPSANKAMRDARSRR